MWIEESSQVNLLLRFTLELISIIEVHLEPTFSAKGKNVFTWAGLLVTMGTFVDHRSQSARPRMVYTTHDQ